MANSPAHGDGGKAAIERRFLSSLRAHLAGWQEKVERDFSREAFDAELRSLQGDAVYRNFGFARPEYVLIRLMGRMSISIGRRLGEMYDKLPRFVAAARFGLPEGAVIEQLDGLELDLTLRRSEMSPNDQRHFDGITQAWFPAARPVEALAIEIRYNFNPNDSARLRKDVRMAELAREAGFCPVYLVFSGISPRQDAIGRLTRAGWHFLVGTDATRFTEELLGVDMMNALEDPAVRAELDEQVGVLMRTILTSEAFQEAVRAPVS